jgi:hypothetical protein
MKNLGDLKAKITQDLRRTNLSAEIADAIPDAIRDHETERFWWNETYPTPYTLTIKPGGGQGGSGVPGNTGAQGDLYLLDGSGLANFQEFIKIDMVRAQLGSGTSPQGVWYTVKAIDWTPLEFFYSVLSNGQPSWWAYRNNYLRIYPLPSQPYPLRIFGHYRATPLVQDTDSNIWTNQGFNLIRYTVLKRLYAYPIRDAQQVQNAMQAGEAALEYLRKETERRSRQGRMRAYYG